MNNSHISQNKVFLCVSFGVTLLIDLCTIPHDGRGYLPYIVYMLAICGFYNLFVSVFPGIIKHRIWKFAVNLAYLCCTLLLFKLLTIFALFIGLCSGGAGYGDGYPPVPLSESAEWLCVALTMSAIIAPYAWYILFKSLFSKHSDYLLLGISCLIVSAIPWAVLFVLLFLSV